ncbi:MAG: NADH-quinone oxidoreductase subunit NuoE [Thermoguttaceae bacterium]|jgi:NADH-quinone oxidoreductase subunit E
MAKVRVTLSAGGVGGAQPDEPERLAERLAQVFARFQGVREELIPLLQGVQEELGYLPESAMLGIARFLRLPESAVYAVATFYAQFRFTPIGKRHVMVCRGTSCHVRGAPRILQEIEKQLGIKEGQVTPDREYSLESVACIGACGLSPCLMSNKKVEAKLTPKKVAEIFCTPHGSK